MITACILTLIFLIIVIGIVALIVTAIGGLGAAAFMVVDIIIGVLPLVFILWLIFHKKKPRKGDTDK